MRETPRGEGLGPNAGLDPSLYNHDLAPVPEEKRTWSWINYSTVWMGMVHNIVAYTTAAGLLGLGMSPWQAIGTVTAANVVLILAMWANSIAGAKYGLPFPVLPEGRVVGVETGGCPHTAIRGDVSMNAGAIEELEREFSGLDLIFVESGGDNLAASFSPELVEASIYVIDVAGGDKVPRKGGPGVTRSELLVINKIDLASLVGADLSVMERDAGALRGDAPTVFTSVLHGDGMPEVEDWVRRAVHHGEWTPATSDSRGDGAHDHPH